MARLFTDGAESGDASRLNGVGSGISASTAQKRTGNYSYLPAGNAGDGGETKPWTAASEWYARFAVRFQSLFANRFFEWLSGSSEAGSLRLVTWGTNIASVSVYDGATLRATSTLFSMNGGEWHVFEIHVKHALVGNIDVKFDGSTVLTFVGITNALATTDRIRMLNVGGGAPYFDDLAVNDTVGGTDDSWCGDGGVLAALVPTGAGNYTDLIASAGSPYACVDEIPANTSDYVYESTTDKKSTYAMSDVAGIPAGASIARVWVELDAEETAADGDKIATLLRSGSTDEQGSDQALSLSYQRFLSAEYLTDPQDSAAWTEAKVNALEAGAVIR